ncbi:PAS domain S-box protein [Aureispira]|nr:PAS domain S-box protein [Aureispira sp.]
MISNTKNQDMDFYKDISILYALSMSIGVSLDIKDNIKHFLSSIVDKMDVNFASVWLNSKITENYISDLYLVCSYPSLKLTEINLPEGLIINDLLTNCNYILVEDTDVLYADITNSQETGIGQYIIYKLEGLGFLKLYSPTKNNKDFRTQMLEQLQSVVNKFNVSLKACIAHEKSVLETEFRKQIQEELEQNEEKYRTVVDNIGEGLIITDLDDKLIFINEQMCKLTGRKSEEVLGIAVCEAFVPKRYQEEYKNKTLARKRGESGQYEIPLLYKDGTHWDAFINASSYKNKNGEIIGTIGAIIDITKRKKEKQEIIESQEKLQLVLNTSLDAIVTIDEQSEVTDWNHIAEEIFGYSRKEAIGRALNELIIPSRMREAHKKGMVRFMQTQMGGFLNKRIELIAIRKSGEEFPVELSVSPIKIQGKFFYSAFLQDITKRKENENALIQAKQDAEHARKMERQFLAHMSHEIRTPMNAVIGMTYLLTQSNLSETQKEYLQALQFSADSLMEIISDILDLSKIEAHEIEFESRMFSLQHILQSLKRTYRFRVQGKNVSVEIHIDDKIVNQIVGDRTRLNQILGNLLNNASKFTTEGYIGVNVVLEEIKEDIYWISFQVYDTGIGISEKNINKIFDSFKQASADTHGEYGGTGLGLSIVKQLVELQGGTIEVNSELDKGTMFEVVLPFKDSGIVDSRGTESPSYTDEIQNRIQELSILIAEDNAINQKLITSLFIQWGANFDLVSNGREAINYTMKKKYDIIFMDINMPVMNGYEAVLELKKNKNNPNCKTPIVTLTAAALYEEKKRMYKAGVYDFITKPFSPKQLQQTIISCLDNSLSLKNSIDDVTNEENYEAQIEDVIKKPNDLSEEDETIPVQKENGLYDLAHLEKFSQNNPQFVSEMLEMYLDQNPKDLQKLEDYLGDKNWPLVKDIAHQMKSIFGTLGMNSEQEIARKIEHNVQEENYLIQQYTNWLDQLKDSTKKINQLLAKELESQKN